MSGKVARLFVIILFCISLFGLSGCATYDDIPGGTIKEITAQQIFSPAMKTKEVTEWRDGRLYFTKKKYVPAGAKKSSAVVEKKTVTIPFKKETPPPADYIVGPNDVLFINVNGNPQYSSAFGSSMAGSAITSKTLLGSRVDGDGDIQFPFIGVVHVGGMTLTQIQKRLQTLLLKYVKKPWVVVEIVNYQSHPLYLLGDFRNSGTFYMDRPLNLLEGLALGSGFDPNADLRAARLIRRNKIVPVDIYDLLTKGDERQNVWLRPGDTVFIPDNTSRAVFVFGAVKKPGPVPMPTKGLTLGQAIAASELRDAGYDINHVRIIRSLSTTRGELIVVDFEKILRGEVLPFPLHEGDIVYVPKNGLGSWSDAMSEILPSLEMIRDVLQPFVQLKYLTRN